MSNRKRGDVNITQYLSGNCYSDKKREKEFISWKNVEKEIIIFTE